MSKSIKCLSDGGASSGLKDVLVSPTGTVLCHHGYQALESEVLHYVPYSNHNSEATQGGAHSPEVLAETRKHLELAALLPRRPGLSGCVQPCL